MTYILFSVIIGFLLIIILLLISKMKSIENALKIKYEAKLKEWELEEEKRIREDAIRRSQSVTVGKVTEQLIPYFPSFNYNPKDVRFIGAPIDFIIFDGLSEGEVKKIVFVEVKSGKSRLNANEKQVKNAIENGWVFWEEMRWSSSDNPLFNSGK
ncbi:MAG: hypothetical protein J7L34_05480 [Thermotogaceae bacterium]|nr:hypothetical protein [Thermotogaceae bacterium]